MGKISVMLSKIKDYIIPYSSFFDETLEDGLTTNAINRLTESTDIMPYNLRAQNRLIHKLNKIEKGTDDKSYLGRYKKIKLYAKEEELSSKLDNTYLMRESFINFRSGIDNLLMQDDLGLAFQFLTTTQAGKEYLKENNKLIDKNKKKFYRKVVSNMLSKEKSSKEIIDRITFLKDEYNITRSTYSIDKEIVHSFIMNGDVSSTIDIIEACIAQDKHYDVISDSLKKLIHDRSVDDAFSKSFRILNHLNSSGVLEFDVNSLIDILEDMKNDYFDIEEDSRTFLIKSFDSRVKKLEERL